MVPLSALSSYSPNFPQHGRGARPNLQRIITDPVIFCADSELHCNLPSKRFDLLAVVYEPQVSPEPQLPIRT